MEWFWVRHWPQRDKRWSLLLCCLQLKLKNLACGRRAGSSTDAAGDGSAESCACPLLLWEEEASLLLSLSCCKSTRVVWLQKLLYKPRKLDPTTCCQMSIWNRANDIYYLDQRDLLFFKGACKCFVASEQFACKVFLTTFIFGLGPKIPQNFEGWAWIFHLCCFWEDFLTYCSKRSHLCPAALTLHSPDGHCFSPLLQ